MAGADAVNNAIKDVEDKKQLCYDEIKGAYDFTLSLMDSLDQKANNLIIISGIILGLYSGFGKSVLDSISKTKIYYINLPYCNCVTYYNPLLYTLIIGLSMLLASILLALLAYKLYNTRVVPNAPYFYEHYVINEEYTKDDILDNLTIARVEAIESNRKSSARKESFIAWSLILLWAGSAVCVIFIVVGLMVTKV